MDTTYQVKAAFLLGGWPALSRGTPRSRPRRRLYSPAEEKWTRGDREKWAHRDSIARRARPPVSAGGGPPPAA